MKQADPLDHACVVDPTLCLAMARNVSHHLALYSCTSGVVAPIAGALAAVARALPFIGGEVFRFKLDAALRWSALLPTTALTLFALLRIGPRLTCWTASAFGMGVRRLIGMGG
ncbi:hypothetical protein O7A70_33270, partial [Mesorhizobium sp. Cs1299R1N1]|uniref:hypothetical protein n=1 Tax=Mesorhizobium sp. Cs1299R1N1 TaxID=3015172 RepID=UPI00301D180F